MFCCCVCFTNVDDNFFNHWRTTDFRIYHLWYGLPYKGIYLSLISYYIQFIQFQASHRGVGNKKRNFNEWGCGLHIAGGIFAVYSAPIWGCVVGLVVCLITIL